MFKLAHFNPKLVPIYTHKDTHIHTVTKNSRIKKLTLKIKTKILSFFDHYKFWPLDNEWYNSLYKRRKWQPISVLFPGKFHEWRSVVGYSPWDHRVGHDWATSLQLQHQSFLQNSSTVPPIWAPRVALVVKKNPAANVGDMRHGFGPWVRKIPWGGRGNTLHYSCLENPRNRGDWWATVHRVTKSQAWLKWLPTHSHNTTCLSSCQMLTLKIKTSNG